MVFGVFDKADSAVTEDGFKFRNKRNCTFRVAKTKALHS